MVSCVSTGPDKEYALAYSAILAAKKSLADKLYPEVYLKALSFYKKAVSFYKRQDYGEARDFFEESIEWAEKAELKARIKQKRLEE